MTSRFYVMRIMPIGLLMALTLLFGNLSYLYLTVAFIQILKAFTPVITMGALFLAGLETPTARLVASVVVIAIGTAIAAAGELNFSLLGVVIMMLSEVFEAARLVLTQKLLTGLRFHPSKHCLFAHHISARSLYCMQSTREDPLFFSLIFADRARDCS